MDTVAITISDLEDFRQVLKACLTYFQAEDLQKAQVAFSAPRQSPLTVEIEQANTRLQGYLGDYLLQRHEAMLDDEDNEAEEDTEEDLGSSQEGLQDVAEGVEGVEDEAVALSENPMGGFERQKSRGQILTAEDLQDE